MRINTKDIYDEFISELKSRRKILKEEVSDYNNSKDYLLNKIKQYKHYIENFTNIRYEDICNLNRLIAEKSVINLANIAGINVNDIRRNINIIVEINKSISKLQSEINQIEANMIGYIVFKEVTYKFNCKLSDEIVYKGYVLNIGYSLGHIRIKKINCFLNRDGSQRTKRRINWNESNKLKKEIELNGEVPYKVTKREGRKIIEDNGGIPWFVYFNNEWDYLWHWYKGTCSVLNTPYYKFRPTIYNNSSRYDGMGNVNKLSQLKTSNSPLLANFTENIIDKGHRKGYLDTLWKGK